MEQRKVSVSDRQTCFSNKESQGYVMLQYWQEVDPCSLWIWHSVHQG